MYIAGVNLPVDTGDTYFGVIALEPISGSRGAKEKLKRDAIRRLPVAGGNELEARVEHARWIVDCENCNSAEYYFEDKLFLCSLCNNSDVGGKTKKVKMPKARKDIEVILGKRKIKNRHWEEPETVEDLENENILHELEVS